GAPLCSNGPPSRSLPGTRRSLRVRHSAPRERCSHLNNAVLSLNYTGHCREVNKGGRRGAEPRKRTSKDRQAVAADLVRPGGRIGRNRHGPRSVSAPSLAVADRAACAKPHHVLQRDRPGVIAEEAVALLAADEAVVGK